MIWVLRRGFRQSIYVFAIYFPIWLESIPIERPICICAFWTNDLLSRTSNRHIDQSRTVAAWTSRIDPFWCFESLWNCAKQLVFGQSTRHIDIVRHRTCWLRIWHRSIGDIQQEPNVHTDKRNTMVSNPICPLCSNELLLFRLNVCKESEYVMRMKRIN